MISHGGKFQKFNSLLFHCVVGVQCVVNVAVTVVENKS